MKPYLKLQSFGAECYTVGPSHDIDEGPAKGPYPRSTSLFSPSIILKIFKSSLSFATTSLLYCDKLFYAKISRRLNFTGKVLHKAVGPHNINMQSPSNSPQRASNMTREHMQVSQIGKLRYEPHTN